MCVLDSQAQAQHFLGALLRSALRKSEAPDPAAAPAAHPPPPHPQLLLFSSSSTHDNNHFGKKKTCPSAKSTSEFGSGRAQTSPFRLTPAGPGSAEDSSCPNARTAQSTATPRNKKNNDFSQLSCQTNQKEGSNPGFPRVSCSTQGNTHGSSKAQTTSMRSRVPEEPFELCR